MVGNTSLNKDFDSSNVTMEDFVMGIKMGRKIAIAVVVFMIVVAFAGCDLAMVSLGSDVDTDTRSLETRTVDTAKVKMNSSPRSFSASVNLYQDYTSVVTRDMGNSNHHKTVQETLYSLPFEIEEGVFLGGAIESDWDLLDGKYVIMDNVTNYNLDEQTTVLNGSNHSTITIVDGAMNPILTLDANGVIKGSLFGAEISMNWVAKESFGSDVKARGKVEGTFVWLEVDPSSGTYQQILPNGTFFLTGTYN
jgi:hypothetical protein